MALNFRIMFYRNNGALIAQLNGDFDGSSALELLLALQQYEQPDQPIQVNTDNINTIYPFGRNVFKNNYKYFLKQSDRIDFTGAKTIFSYPY